MHLTTRVRQSGEIEFGILYGAITVLALAAARVLPLADLLPSCVFRAVTGIPCPACGATRALVHVAHGDVVHALAMNPVVALTLIGALLFLLYNGTAVFAGSRLSLSFSAREASFLRAGTAVLLLANWFYVIVAL